MFMEKNKNSKTNRLTVLLSDEELALLEKKAVENQSTKSEFVRSLIVGDGGSEPERYFTGDVVRSEFMEARNAIDSVLERANFLEYDRPDYGGSSERIAEALFVDDEHLEITRDALALQEVIYWLLQGYDARVLQPQNWNDDELNRGVDPDIWDKVSGDFAKWYEVTQG